jgi:hypothetical protein
MKNKMTTALEFNLGIFSLQAKFLRAADGLRIREKTVPEKYSGEGRRVMEARLRLKKALLRASVHSSLFTPPPPPPRKWTQMSYREH